MNRRRAVQVGIVVWAVVGAAMALSALRNVNADARLFVGLVSVVGPLAAVVASRLLAVGVDRCAGAFLLVSVLTPTYFAYIFNLPPLLVGLGLVFTPRVIRPRANGAAERARLV